MGRRGDRKDARQARRNDRRGISQILGGKGPRARAARAGRGTLLGSAPMPDGKFDAVGLVKSSYSFTANAGSAGERGYMWHPHMDIGHVFTASAWSATWSENGNHPKKTEIAAAYVNARGVRIRVSVESLLAADDSPGRAFFGHVKPADSATTALSTSALAEALVDVRGKPLESMAWGAGSQLVLEWTPRVEGDYESRATSVTTNLTNSFSDSSLNASKLILGLTGFSASQAVATVTITYWHEGEVTADYDGIIPSVPVFENPSMAAVDSGIRKNLLSSFPGRNAIELDDAFANLDIAKAQSIALNGMEDVASVVNGVLASEGAKLLVGAGTAVASAAAAAAAAAIIAPGPP